MNESTTQTSGKIKIAIIGVGNCSSSLIQGIHYYRSKHPEEAIGLMYWDLKTAFPAHFEGWEHYKEGADGIRKAFDAAKLGGALNMLEPGQSAQPSV